VISAMANWPFAGIRSIGWGWTGVIWIFNIVTYMLLDPIKFLVRYALSGKSWDRMVEGRVRRPKKRQNHLTLNSVLHNYVGLTRTRDLFADCTHRKEEFWPRRKNGCVGHREAYTARFRDGSKASL